MVVRILIWFYAMHVQVYLIIKCIILAYKAVIIDVDNKSKQQV